MPWQWTHGWQNIEQQQSSQQLPTMECFSRILMRAQHEKQKMTIWNTRASAIATTSHTPMMLDGQLSPYRMRMFW